MVGGVSSVTAALVFRIVGLVRELTVLYVEELAQQTSHHRFTQSVEWMTH